MEVTAQTKPAGLGIRVLAAVIDSALVCVAWYYVVQTWGDVGPDGDWVLTGSPALMLMLATAAFWILPEWLLGATLGKWACDLRVTTLRGGSISLGQSLKRNLLRLLDLAGFYLVGFVAAALTPNRQRLGDLWAKTIVVSRQTRQAVVEVPPT